MKKYILLLCLLIMVSACSKAPMNGSIDGFLNLTSIELSAGETIFPSRIYYSIYRTSIQISDQKNKSN